MKKLFFFIIACVAGILLPIQDMALAQEEVTSALRRYKLYEQSTGYYEQYEVKPRRQRPLVSIPGVKKGIFPYSPTGSGVRTRTRLADSHMGIQFYERRRCEECHVSESRDAHTVRANLTCRQCHGGEPIASLAHYYSPMNPIRRHAAVCAKCHEGAGASYASYVVHSPNPALLTTKTSFPVLFYVFWIMVFIAGATFVLFLPHTVVWIIREFFIKKEKNQGASKGKK